MTVSVQQVGNFKGSASFPVTDSARRIHVFSPGFSSLKKKRTWEKACDIAWTDENDPERLKLGCEKKDMGRIES